MKAIGITDQGLVRSSNQDTIYCCTGAVGSLPNLLVVADGMGGEHAGGYASKTLVLDLVQYIKQSKDKQHINLIKKAIELSNSDLYADSLADKDKSGMGTTLVTAIVENGVLYVSNVGDSRLYIIDDHIEQITKDHSYVEELVERGQLVRGSKDYNSKKNIITRAVGITNTVNIDFFEVDVNLGDVILLCSDGLTNMLSDEEIKDIILQEDDIEKAAKKLIEEANSHGGKDNISVILAVCEESEVIS